jgi:hypothetical protein
METQNFNPSPERVSRIDHCKKMQKRWDTAMVVVLVIGLALMSLGFIWPDFEPLKRIQTLNLVVLLVSFYEKQTWRSEQEGLSSKI